VLLTNDIRGNTLENAVEKCRVVLWSFNMLIRLSKGMFPRPYIVHSIFQLFRGQVVDRQALLACINFESRKRTSDFMKRR
jgi:hypothetical protein